MTMPKRVTWFVVGAAAGATGSLYARRKARKAVERMQPTNVAKVAVVKARSSGRNVVDALKEGREAMRAKEAELRDLQEGRLTGPNVVMPQGPTIVVVEGAQVLDGDEFRARRGGPRRRARR